MSNVIKLSSPETKQFWEIPVLFEDEHILALDKPSGLPVSPESSNSDGPNLLQLMHDAIAAGKPWAIERNLSYISNAHRLDTEATGVLIFAKAKPVLIALADHFGTDKPGHTFVALVNGEPIAETFEVDAKLTPHPTHPSLLCVDPGNGKKARTLFEVVERFRSYTLLHCRPATLRPHQIRVHLRHARLPVCGDTLYGGRPLLLSRLKKDYRLKPGRTELPLISDCALHAEQMTLAHPITGEALTLTAPLPKDLRVALKYLRQCAA